MYCVYPREWEEEGGNGAPGGPVSRFPIYFVALMVMRQEPGGGHPDMVPGVDRLGRLPARSPVSDAATDGGWL
jgi:hypothetical protein